MTTARRSRFDVTLLRDRIVCAARRRHVEPPGFTLTVDALMNGRVVRCERCGKRLRWEPPMNEGRARIAVTIRETMQMGSVVYPLHSAPIALGAITYQEEATRLGIVADEARAPRLAPGGPVVGGRDVIIDPPDEIVSIRQAREAKRTGHFIPEDRWDG